MITHLKNNDIIIHILYVLLQQCFVVFCVRKHPRSIRRRLTFPRTSCGVIFILCYIYVILIFRRNDEKKPLLTSGTTTINYKTILTIPIPYAHVIRDDKIQIESSDVVDTNTTDTYLLFNGTISDQAYETGMFINI